MSAADLNAIEAAAVMVADVLGLHLNGYTEDGKRPMKASDRDKIAAGISLRAKELNGAQKQQWAMARNKRLEAEQAADARRWRKAKRLGFPRKSYNPEADVYYWRVGDGDDVFHKTPEAAIDAASATLGVGRDKPGGA